MVGLVTDPVLAAPPARREDASSTIPLVPDDTVRELPFVDRTVVVEVALEDVDATRLALFAASDAGAAGDNGDGDCWESETEAPLEGIPRTNSSPSGCRQ